MDFIARKEANDIFVHSFVSFYNIRKKKVCEGIIDLDNRHPPLLTQIDSYLLHMKQACCSVLQGKKQMKLLTLCWAP